MLRTRRTTPGFIEPCLPSAAKHPPSGPGWLHEVKHDGFRLMARRDAVGVRLFTRNGIDWSGRFPLIVRAISALKARSCLIDGEAIAYADDGLASFELLRGRHHDRLVALCAFDLLELDERDLCCTPLEDRERVLARLALSLRPLARLDQDDVLLAKSGRWGAYGEHRLNQRGRVAKAWRD
jgi:ATP-dependent DNA ligase